MNDAARDDRLAVLLPGLGAEGQVPGDPGPAGGAGAFDDANTLLDEIIADGSSQAQGGYGFWPAHAEGDDIVIGAGPRPPSGCRCCRQQTAKPAGRANRCLADYVAPAGDHLGGFAVAIHGAEDLAAKYEDDRDDYQAIMVKALADRLAEAFAEHIHLQARRDWFEPDADPAIEDLHAERFRGIRPAFGYPASPDHSLKRELFACSAPRLGMSLTESFAMSPAASVSGLIFAHPASRYFTVGRIGRDQAADYAGRRGITLDRGGTLAAPQPLLRPLSADARPGRVLLSHACKAIGAARR